MDGGRDALDAPNGVSGGARTRHEVLDGVEACRIRGGGDERGGRRGQLCLGHTRARRRRGNRRFRRLHLRHLDEERENQCAVRPCGLRGGVGDALGWTPRPSHRTDQARSKAGTLLANIPCGRRELRVQIALEIYAVLELASTVGLRQSSSRDCGTRAAQDQSSNLAALGFGLVRRIPGHGNSGRHPKVAVQEQS